jgi:hypothetical protein
MPYLRVTFSGIPVSRSQILEGHVLGCWRVTFSANGLEGRTFSDIGESRA